MPAKPITPAVPADDVPPEVVALNQLIASSVQLLRARHTDTNIAGAMLTAGIALNVNTFGRQAVAEQLISLGLHLKETPDGHGC